jgi:hypothetical protein
MLETIAAGLVVPLVTGVTFIAADPFVSSVFAVPAVDSRFRERRNKVLTAYAD